jgi:biotin carboxyl carrier protein
MKFIALISGKQIPVEVDQKNGNYCLTIGEKTFTVNAIRPDPQFFSLLVEGESYEVAVEKRDNRFEAHFHNGTIGFELYEARKFKASELAKKSTPAGPLKIYAPMPGKIVKIAVIENKEVKEGDALLIMEAMKMQNELKAPRPGRVLQVLVSEGAPVSSQQVLIVME